MKKLIKEYGEGIKSIVIVGTLLGLVWRTFFVNGIVQLLFTYITELYG